MANNQSSRPLQPEAVPPGEPPREAPTPIELPQPAREEETRALWVTRWDWRTQADIEQLVQKAAAAGFTALFFQVRGNGDAYYRSRLEPWAQPLTGTLGRDPGWDPLGTVLQAASSLGVEVHAYVNVYPAWLGETPPPESQPQHIWHRFNLLYAQGWLQWHQDKGPLLLNEHYTWSSPGHPAVAEHVRLVVADLLEQYALAGVHLDYVRTAGWRYSHDPVSLDRYADARALQPDLSFRQWQRDQITGLVSAITAEVHRQRPGAWTSAATWPVWQDRWDWWTTGDAYDGFCQDSVGWLQRGEIDAICPMLYSELLIEREDYFRALVQAYVQDAPGKRVFPGIWADFEDFGAIARRIQAVRAAGLPGYAVFSARLVEKHNWWDAFRGV